MSGCSQIPWCPACDMPVVSTFLASFKEYYCVGCGGSWAWFGEPRDDGTPERVAAAEELKVRFGIITKPIIVSHSKIEGCDRCWGPGGTDHSEHATDEEHAASGRAWDALHALRLPANARVAR